MWHVAAGSSLRVLTPPGCFWQGAPAGLSCAGASPPKCSTMLTKPQSMNAFHMSYQNTISSDCLCARLRPF